MKKPGRPRKQKKLEAVKKRERLEKLEVEENLSAESYDEFIHGDWPQTPARNSRRRLQEDDPSASDWDEDFSEEAYEDSYEPVEIGLFGEPAGGFYGHPLPEESPADTEQQERKKRSGAASDHYDETLSHPLDSREPEGDGRKKRRKKNYPLRVIVVLLLLAGVYLGMTSSYFDVRAIDVKKDGDHFTPEQIVALSGLKKGDNLFKIRLSKAEEALMNEPYVRSVKIERVLPQGIRITLKEKTENFLVKYAGGYLIIGDTDHILDTTDQVKDLPLMEGIEVKNSKPGQILRVADEKQLADVQDLVEAMQKEGLTARRVDVSGISPRVYLSDQLVIEGAWADVKKSMDALMEVLADLERKSISRGTLKVSGNDTCSFSPVFSG